MKKVKTLLSLFLVAAIFSAMVWEVSLPVFASGTATYYVSLQGDDSWSGTLADPNGTNTDGPFKTIERARDVVREDTASMSSDITVVIRGGEYTTDTTISFDERDSGRNGFKVIYKNYPGENPIINGGEIVGDWSNEGTPNANIYKTYIGTGWNFNTLYENGVRSIKARYPNLVNNENVYNTVADSIDGNTYRQFGFNAGDIPAGLTAGDSGLQTYIWPGGPSGDWNWHTNIIDISTIDYENNTVTLGSGSTYEMGAGSRYFVQGSLDLLDIPGEFYLDKTAGVLYYWPHDAANLGVNVVAPKVKRLIEFKGSSPANLVSDIQFEGITIRNSDCPEQYVFPIDTQDPNWIDGMVYLENETNITVKNCTIHNTGANGIMMSNFSQNNTIYGNLIYDIGVNAIIIDGGAASLSNINKNNTVENNYIYRAGQIAGHGSGINIAQSSGNRIAYNRIKDIPRYGIDFTVPQRPANMVGAVVGGTTVTWENVRTVLHCSNNIVEFNDISNVLSDSQDAGAINSWGAGPGNVIRNNLLHDLGVKFSFGLGIYLDDGSEDFTVENNIVYNLKQKGTGNMIFAFNDCGPKNKYINNIAANNDIAIATLENNQRFGEQNYDLEVIRNIFYNSGDALYSFENWKDDHVKESNNNLLYNNNNSYRINGVAFAGTFAQWQSARGGIYDQHSQIADPKFMDQANNDYRLRYDSPAYKLGINDLNIEDIGLKDDFVFADDAEALDKIYIKKQGESVNSGGVSLEEGATAVLELTGRTVSGYDADLSTAGVSFDAITMQGTNVLSVDSAGVITGISEGIAKVIATVSKNGTTKTVELYVLVDNTFNSLTLNIPKTSLLVNDSTEVQTVAESTLGQFKNVNATTTFTCESTPSDAITMAGAVIHANGPGSAVITATDSSTGLTQTASVGAFDSLLDTISAKMDRQTLYAGQTSQLDVLGIMSDAGAADLSAADIQYTVDNSVCVNVTGESGNPASAVVTSLQEGKAIITVTASLNGVVRTATQKVVVYPDIPNKVTAPWNIKHYGNAGGVTSYDQSTGVYAVQSNGYDVWNSSDEFVYLYQDVQQPEAPAKISITAKIDAWTLTHPDGAVGVMFRSTDSELSKHVFLRVLNGGTLLLVKRDTDSGASNYQVRAENLTFPVELKLTKEGNVYEAFYKQATDEDWVSATNLGGDYNGNPVVNMGSDIMAGVGVFSRDTSKTLDANVSHINITTDMLELSGLNLTAAKHNLHFAGQTLQLTPSGIMGTYTTVPVSSISGASVTYSSDHEDVATVDANGLVTAVTDGSVRITAVLSIAESQQFTATFDIMIGAETGKLDRFGWAAGVNQGYYSAPEYIFDGLNNTYFSSGTFQVPDTTALTIDMTEQKTFNRLMLETDPTVEDWTKGYAVYISDDSACWDNNDFDWGDPVKAGAGVKGTTTIIMDSAVNARYIRIVQTGTDNAHWWAINELNVYNDTTALSGNADLSAVTLNNGSIPISFDPAVTSYTVNTASDVSSVDLGATVADTGKATVSINNQIIESGLAASITLGYGSNIAEITVAAENGSTKTYTVVIKRVADFSNRAINRVEAESRSAVQFDWGEPTNITEVNDGSAIKVTAWKQVSYDDIDFGDGGYSEIAINMASPRSNCIVQVFLDTVVQSNMLSEISYSDQYRDSSYADYSIRLMDMKKAMEGITGSHKLILWFGMDDGGEGVCDLDYFELLKPSGSSNEDQAPSRPVNLAVSGKTDSSVTLIWDAPEDLNGTTVTYDVFEGSHKVNATAITATSFTVTGLTPDTTYSFTVTAKDAAGNTSEASIPKSVTTNPASTPTPTPTPTPTSTPTPTPTPTPVAATPTPAPLQEEIQEVVDAIKTAAEGIANEQDAAKAQIEAIELIKTNAVQIQSLKDVGLSTTEVDKQLRKVADIIMEKVSVQNIVTTVSGHSSDTVVTDAAAAQMLKQLDAVLDAAAKLNKTLAESKSEARVESVLTIKATGTEPATTENATAKIPAVLFAAAAEKKIDKIAVDTGIAKIAISPDAVTSKAGDTISLSANKVQASTLSAATRAAVGDSQVFDFTVTVSDTRITTFKKPVEVTLPFTLKAGDNPEKVTVFYLNESGELENVIGQYDVEHGTVHFSTDHFSRYVAKVNNVTFGDIANYGGIKTFIEVMASKGIFEGILDGIENNRYAPEAKVTRAQFVALVVKALKLPNTAAANGFSDVNKKDWFHDAVSAAVSAGLIQGNGNGIFAPNEIITRQDMAVIVAKALTLVKGKTRDTQKDVYLARFTDSGSIGAYAKDAVSMIVQYRIMQGVSTSSFAPGGFVSRAQAAVVIYKLFNLY